MTLAEFAGWCGETANEIEEAARYEVHRTLHDAHLIALDYSSGPFTRNQLRRRPEPDHPYARRHGQPKYDPTRINIQSGELASHWQEEGPVESDGDFLAVLGNTSIHAAYLYGDEHDRPDVAGVIEHGGNDVAFGRPLPDRVVLELEPIVFQRFQARIVMILLR